MVKADVMVNRSPQTVWNFFTTKANWKEWWGSDLTQVNPAWRGGAAFTDGGASHRANMQSVLAKFKQRVEMEPDASPAASKPQCPHCGQVLTGMALIMFESAMSSKELVDFQTTCPSCGKAITRANANNPARPIGNRTAPKKWWAFWK